MNNCSCNNLSFDILKVAFIFSHSCEYEFRCAFCSFFFVAIAVRRVHYIHAIYALQIWEFTENQKKKKKKTECACIEYECWVVRCRLSRLGYLQIDGLGHRSEPMWYERYAGRSIERKNVGTARNETNPKSNYIAAEKKTFSLRVWTSDINLCVFGMSELEKKKKKTQELGFP